MAEEKTERENLIKEREKKEDLTYIMGLFGLKLTACKKNLLCCQFCCFFSHYISERQKRAKKKTPPVKITNMILTEEVRERQAPHFVRRTSSNCLPFAKKAFSSKELASAFSVI